MFVKYSKELIWWKSVNEDRPSNQYFDDFKNRMTNIDMNVNFHNYETIQVIIPERDITYLWVNHKGFDYFYFFDSVQKVLSNGYQAIFTLDLYTTYTLNYIKDLIEKQVKVKAVRNHVMNDKSTQYTDPMLESVPKLIDDTYYYCDYFTRTRKQAGQVPPPYEQIVTWMAEGRNTRGFSLSPYSIANGTTYYVFKFPTNDAKNKPSFIYVPVLWNQIDTRYQCISHPNIDNGDFFYCGNNEDDILYLANHVSDAKFLGKFTLPSFYDLDNWDRYTFTFKLENGQTVTQHMACIIIHGSGEWDNIKFGENSAINELVDTSRDRPDFNKDDKLSYYASNYINLKVFNQDINTPLYLKRKRMYFNFSSLGYFAYDNYYQSLANNIFNFPDALPVFTDTYTQFISSTQNVRDTSISIARQNMIMDVVRAPLYGMKSMLSGFLKANPTSYITGALDTTFGIANSVLGYNQKRNMIDAQLGDYRAQKGVELNFSSNEQTVINAEGYNITFRNLPEATDRKEYVATLWCRANKLSKDTILSLNRVISLYGNYNPIVDTINNMTPNSDYNYLQLDVEFLSNLFPTTINPQVPRTYYSLILNDVTQGIRIWNETPRYI